MNRDPKFDKAGGASAEQAIMERIARMMQEKQHADPGYTLVFHFDTQEEADKVWKRVVQMGGLSTSCEGHYIDDADMPGYAVVDVMHDLIIDQEIHPDEWSAMDVMDSWVEDETILPMVYGLVPLNMLASDRCAGYAQEEQGE